MEIGVIIGQVSLCIIIGTREAWYKKSLLKRYPLFSCYVFVMTALLVADVPFRSGASVHGIAAYHELIRLINLLMLSVVCRREVYPNTYGPKMSLPDWVWKQAHILMLLSFLTALVITSASIYSADISASWIEASIKFVARFLCIALISLAIYARKLSIARRPSRTRMLLFGLIFYVFAEGLYSTLPVMWQVEVFLAGAYGVTLLIWIAALILHRYEPPPSAHPDILKEFLELASIHIKEATEFLEEEKMRRRIK